MKQKIFALSDLFTKIKILFHVVIIQFNSTFPLPSNWKTCLKVNELIASGKELTHRFNYVKHWII